MNKSNNNSQELWPHGWRWLLIDSLAHGREFSDHATGKISTFDEIYSRRVMATPRFEISNVARLLSKTANSFLDHEIDLSDLPPISFPFPEFWMELVFVWGSEPVDVAFRIIRSYETESNGVPCATNGTFIRNKQFAGNATITAFIGFRDSQMPIVITRTSTLGIDDNGKVINFRAYGKQLKEIQDDDNATAEQSLANSFYVPMYALALLSCKNVSTVSLNPTRQQKRHQDRASGVALVSYKVLGIGRSKLIKQALKSESAITRNCALHICRGHFKTYDEHGLFGSKKGTWWWPDTVRGEYKKGVIVKDYDINPRMKKKDCND